MVDFNDEDSKEYEENFKKLMEVLDQMQGTQDETCIILKESKNGF